MSALGTSVTRYFHDLRTTRTQLFAFLMAAWFTGNGVTSFAINADFSMHPMHSETIHLLGFIPVTVNGWHGVFHLATGLVGLLCVRRKSTAIRYAVVTALVYIAAAAFGFIGGTSVCGMMAVDTFANWVHLTEGLLLTGIAGYGLVRDGAQRSSTAANSGLAHTVRSER
ncbi:DUF4383 domain-containing protein [Nocardia sp. NPDC051756]|uniref:DUF4383 domain-containing protein n=1 Tax=Nocardia sp. NPDC051756 TaxID=3154751 RepID=UPI00342CBC71